MNDMPLWKRTLLWSAGEDGRVSRYAIIAAVSLAMVWVPSLAYLTLATRIYRSEWTLILPGSGSNTSVNLENIGQASSTASSPYGSNSLSPKVNYKSIAESRTVLKEAADKMGVDLEHFGKPRIELIEQTALLLFTVEDKSPELANAKSWALYQAMQAQLDRLRKDEIQRREEGSFAMMNEYRTKLDAARDRLLAYQGSADIVKVQQFKQMADSVQQLHTQLAQVQAERARAQGEMGQLVSSLGLKPEQAADALTLQTDRLFQKSQQQYVEANVLLGGISSKWGANHPDVIKEQGRRDAAKAMLTERVKTLLKGRNSQILDLISLDQDLTRDALFQKLLTLDAESKGLQSKAAELERIIGDMEGHVGKDTQMAATLDELQRDHQIAEAVFTSALARIDTGKSDLYVSYPLLQMLSEPTLPVKPSSPHTLFVLAGMIVATLFTCIGLALLWIRKPLLNKILLNESNGISSSKSVGAT